MKLFIVFSLFLVCFSTQAQVVCKDPNSAGGNEVAEAGNSPSLCRTNVRDASQGAVDRVDVASYLDILNPDTQIIKPEEKSRPAEGSDTGSTKGSVQ